MIKTSIPKLHSIKFKDGAHAENVIHLQSDSVIDIPVINVLEAAAKAMLQNVVLIGYDAEGYEYVAGSIADHQRAAYMFARGHLCVLRASD